MSAERPSFYRPCLVLAHQHREYALEACRRFRRLGWDVYQAANGPEVRRLARMLEPELIVLGVHLEGESGWLTCAKLKQDRNEVNVLLVTEDDVPQARLLAEQVGAKGVVGRGSGAASLVQAAWQPPAAVAG